MSLQRVAASLVVGILAFLVVAVATTTLLDQVVWPSAIVGIPVGLLAGALAAVATAMVFEK